MVQTSSEAETALSQALHAANTQLVQQRDFVTAVSVFQKQLEKDIDMSNKKAQSYLTTFMKNVDSAVQTMLSKITSATKEVETSVVGLSQVCRREFVQAFDFSYVRADNPENQ